MRIHPAGLRGVLILLSAGLLLLLTARATGSAEWVRLPGMLLVVGGLFLTWFYRDPDRHGDAPDGQLLSAADGKVLQVKALDHCPELDGPGTQISVFMSPLNVHVNRAPLPGKVLKVEYRPGKYLMAFHEKSSELNEACLLVMEDASGCRVAFRQIAGFLARRVRWHVKEGDTLERGERYGIIKLGSRLDHFLPPAYESAVKPGDKVTAGVTVIGVPS